MVKSTKRKQARDRRKANSARGKIRKRSDRPRLSVFRSSTNIYCQIIDDEAGRTLAAASSRDAALRDEIKGLKKTDAAAKVGTRLADRAKEAGVTRVVFDRGRYKFHGRVKALADAARSAGLEF